MTSQELIGKCRQRFKELALKEYDWVSFYNGWLEGRMDLMEFQVSKMTDEELEELKMCISDEKNKRYVYIPIINKDGNISRKINEETGFDCFHRYAQQEYTSGIGTNYVKIPSGKFTEDLEKDLLKKYDDV